MITLFATIVAVFASVVVFAAASAVGLQLWLRRYVPALPSEEQEAEYERALSASPRRIAAAPAIDIRRSYDLLFETAS